MPAEIGTIKVQGREVTVGASTDGRWFLKFEGEFVGNGASLDEAKAAARKRFKKGEVEVAVPFLFERKVRYTDGEIEVVEGTARGLHAGNGSALVTIGGKRDTIERSYQRNSGVWKADTPREVIEQRRELRRQQNDLERQGREIDNEWSLDLSKAVRDAIDEAASA